MNRTLGRSGLLVSPHGLGTMTWGRETDVHEARELLEVFLAAGGNYLDTAPFFGEGRSEAIAAQALKQADRSSVVVASHGGRRPKADRPIDSSRSFLLPALDATLKALELEYLDVWFIDRFDPLTPVEELLLTMDIAVRSGRTRYVGVGNYSGWQLAQIASLAGDSIPLVASSMEYSLVQRGIEREHLDAAIQRGVAVVPWSPLGRGVLTGKYRNGVPADSRGASPVWGRWLHEHLSADARRVVEAVAMAASGLGLAPIDVALAWSRARTGTVAALLGPRTVGQLRAALANVDLVLPQEIAVALDEVSALLWQYPDPGPRDFRA
ncbi:MAG: aldo/keto reductase [Candidatus Nanopelagicales bacterium]